MQNFLTVGQQVLVLFLLIFCGFVLGKKGVMNEKGAKVCADIALILATPCVIIQSFMREYRPEMLLNLLKALLIAFLIHLLAIGLAHLVYRKTDATAKVFRLSVVLSNAGFMALPLQQAVLGEEGVFYGAAYVVVFNLVLWSYGVVVMDSANGKVSPKKLLLSPGAIGVLVGVAVFVGQITLPEVLNAPIRHLASLNTPLPMLFAGYYLSKIDIGTAIRQKSYYGVIALRLVAVPAVCIALMYLCGVRGVLLTSMAIASTAPVAVGVSMFSGRYGQDTESAVNLVALSTLFSAVTMPLLVAVTQLLPT